MHRSRHSGSPGIETLSISSLSDIELDDIANNGRTRNEAKLCRKRSYSSHDKYYPERDPRNVRPALDSIVDPSVCDFQEDLLHGSSARIPQQRAIDNRLGFSRDKHNHNNRHNHESKSYDKERRDYKGKRKLSADRSDKAEKKTAFDRLGYSAEKDHEEKSNQKYDHKESKSTRLCRLEKMVELLVTNTLETTFPATSYSEAATSQAVSHETVQKSFNVTTSTWLNKISNECLENEYDDNMCIKFLQSNASGLMKSWFKTIDAFEYTWPELKMLIIQMFPDTFDFAATLRLLVDRIKQPNETITQYYFAKIYLAEACKISGSNAVSCLIDGLNDPNIQKHARDQNFVSPEIFYTQFLTKLPNFGLQEPVNKYAELPDRKKPREIDSRLFNNKCQVCKRNNHTTEKCYFRKKSIKCDNCGKMGHLTEVCYK